MSVPDPVVLLLGLGSNLGDRADMLQSAVNAIHVEVARVISCSSVYETEPWGLPDQPKYLNCVIEAETLLEPEEVLKRCKSIEIALGRMEAPRNHPRCIDIDVLYFGARELSLPGLVLPHPGIPKRRFVLQPLAELVGHRRLPVGEQPASMLAVCTDMGRVWKTTLRLEIPE